jgi:ABC-type bacteriocin/lantibiotic exporter with double-glycine peptidase domain
MLINEKPNQKKEMEILINGLKFNRLDFTIGQINFVARKYRKKIVIYVQDKKTSNLFKRLPVSKRVKIIQKDVNINLIKKLLKSPLILYLDDYMLRKEGHFPHAIVVWKFNRNRFVISDPWDGKIKKLSSDSLFKGLRLMRNVIRFSPTVIQIK